MQNAVESGICDRLRLRRVGRAVDGTGLENRHTLTGIGGSNPSLSASSAQALRLAALAQDFGRGQLT